METKGKEICVICKAKSSCFKILDNDELKYSNSRKVELVFNSGETIIKQGTFVKQIFFVKSGLVKLYIEVDKERSLILDIITEGNLIGLPALYTENIFKYSVAAIKDSTICAIDIDVFENLVEQNGKFAKALINELNTNTNKYFQKFICLTQKQLNGRLADALLYLADKIYHADEFDLCLSRKELAEFTGMSTMSLIRVLKEFKQDAIVQLNGDRMTLLNKKLLEKLSESG